MRGLASDPSDPFTECELARVRSIVLHQVGDVDGMLLHSSDYLELFSIVVVAWQWLWSYVTFQRGARLITGDDEL